MMFADLFRLEPGTNSYRRDRFTSRDGGQTWDLMPKLMSTDSTEDHHLVLGRDVFESEKAVLEYIIARLEGKLTFFKGRLEKLNQQDRQDSK